MPSFERELPSDRHVRHQHSASSNALVPMWDSSDPDRAPPPLPLNPQSPTVTVSASRPGTSLAIQSAHAALTEKARENALVPVPHRRTTDISPERGLVQRSPHKRMQSLQPGSVRDLSLMIEAGRDSASPTPRGSPEKDRSQRPSTPIRGKDPEKEARSVERDISIASLPQPISSNMTPAMRSSTRWSQQSILGENTPPQSATMLALHHTGRSSPPAREIELPLANVTNNAAAQPKSLTSSDQISNQLVALTNIATSLQKEMSALSRRSRDNATDLMSLKEATHARDEDIRKSLRDLVSNVDIVKQHRDPYNGGPYLDNRAFNTSPVSKTARAYALPRIPSPNSFAASLDRESILSTPSLVGSETPATMALLEKIIREMGTKDGQDSIFDRLSELAERLNGMASANKVEELLEYLKTMKEEHSIISVVSNHTNTPRSLSFDSTSEGSTREVEWNHNAASGQKVERITIDKDGHRSTAPARPTEVLNDDILKIIHSVKDSVAQGGGLTAEVKALVRELRGEVLGMGRELGRKLEESGGRSSHSKSDISNSREELVKIVEESLEQMKLYMQQRLREHRRESTESTKSSGIDYQEFYNAMRSAISDSQELHRHDPQLSRDDVLNAVKEAWEKYKPEIEIQQLGLERDEVLACIKEGLREYNSLDEAPQSATKDEVFTAVAEGLKHFSPPQIETLSREDILEAVRECLEEFEFPVAPSAIGNDLTREDMLGAVKQGLDEFDFPDLSKALVPHDGGNIEILDRLQDIMEYMQNEFKLQQILQYLQSEFKSVSEEARQNIAANEQNTEQVLDATRDGFETLRAHIEEYVDRVADNNGAAAQEELMANLVNSFDSFRDELSDMMAKASDNSRDLVKQEIVSLRDTVNSSLVPHVPPPSDNREIFEAIRESLNQVRSDLLRPHAGTTDILDALHEGFGDMRACLERITDKPVDLTANDEILDALRSGLDDVRADIDTLRGSGDNDKALARITSGSMDLMIPTDLVKHDDIKSLEVTMHDDFKSLEVVVAQLQTRMEAMGAGPLVVSPALEGRLSKEDLVELGETLRQGVSKEDLNEMEEMLRKAVSKEDLNEIEEMLQKAVSKEDLNELEEMLRKAVSKEGLDEADVNSQKGVSKEDLNQIEEVLQKAVSKDDLNDIKEVLGKVVSKDDLGELEEMLRNMQQSVAGVVATTTKDSDAPANGDDAATKEDVQAIETILRNTKSRLDDLIDGEQAVRKDHIDAVEALVLETKDSFGSFSAQLETLTRKEDLTTIESLITQVTAALDEMKEQAEKSLESPEKVTKTDVNAIEAALLEIKSVVEKISNVDIAGLPSKDDLKNVEGVVVEIKDYNSTTLPSKEDLQAVEGMVREIREHNSSNLPSKDDLKLVEDVVREIKDYNTEVLPSKEDLKMVESIVKEIKEYNAAQEEANATALANRQAEVLSVNERVTDIKAFLENFQAVTKERLDAGGNCLETLGRMLEGLGEATNQSANVGSDLKQFFELLKTEFDEFKGGVVGAKLDTDEKLREVADSINMKIAEKVDELVTKYDDFQLVMEDRTKAGEARDVEMEAAVVGNKAVTEELKVLMDTLGSTVTDSLEKMEEASKTVFDKVEVLYGKSEDNHADDKDEHERTREQVKHAIGVVEGLQGQVADYQPRILDAVKDLLLVAGEHFEHSKVSVADIQRYIDDAKSPPPEKYDDSEVHSKLDRLVDHTHTANHAYAQLDTLDKVHQQVVQTAADISEFLSLQRQRVEDECEDREKALQETTLALERQRAEQEHIVANLVVLRDEESQLRENILALRAEQELLTRQKTRMTADVSSLETALHLRREELHAMDVRAEALERRILEGVLDHSRALLMTKSSAKGREAMSRKRVAQSNLGAGEQANKSRTAVNMAVKNNRASLIQPNSASRRILSLSQITNNLPAGGIKRSQSVRTPGPTSLRKSSWVPGGGARKGYGDLDKENADSMRESDEDGQDGDVGRDMPISVDIPEEDETVAYAADGPDDYERHGEDLDFDSEVGTTVITGAGQYSDLDPGSDHDEGIVDPYHFAGEDDGLAEIH